MKPADTSPRGNHRPFRHWQTRAAALCLLAGFASGTFPGTSGACIEGEGDAKAVAGEGKKHKGKPNRLAKEKSPYLQQHAYNPVDWYPWGKEAFEKAKATGRPIFLSIGYSTCHWCHVMERESFENEEIAAYLPGRLEAIGRERDLQLNADWWEPGALTDDRTSLITDPSNGRLPAMTAAARHRANTLGLRSRSRPADGPEDRERYERCIMGRTVPLMAVAPNRLLQIFQTPDYVVILHEQNSDLRVIPIGSGRVLPAAVRQWQGQSRGRWEGDTLVVETSSFNGAWTLNGTSANLRVVAESFAGPWTVTFPVTPATGPLFENACHEGNYSMPLILSGARAQERAARGTSR